MTSLFFSYSHQDENLRNELDKHLSILKRQGVISAWHDRCLNAGSEFNSEISNYLKSASVILLLVSSDFLASDYCYENEMKYAMNMHEKSEAVVIPVILRPCDWRNTPFGHLLSIPKDGKPVVKYTSLDEAFLEITTEIKRVTESLYLAKEPNVTSEQKAKSSISLPRSSNLKITKKFSDHEKDKFIDDAFDYIANFFEGSLVELKNRNPHVAYRYKRIDSQTFHASLYINGNSKTECMIFYGGTTGKGISYSNKISLTQNSFNESLSVEEDGYNLYLKAFGILGLKQKKDLLTFEGAAEYYWEMFIEPSQKS